LPGECCPKFDNCSSISNPIGILYIGHNIYYDVLKYILFNCFNIEHTLKGSIDSKKSSVSNIYHWSLSTEQSYKEDSVWKRDTSKSLKQESSTVPIIMTMPSTFLNPKKVSRQMNMSSSNNSFAELDASTISSILEKNITYNNSTNEINIPDNLVTDTTIDDFNITEDSKTLFLGFEIDNLTTNEYTTDSSSIINNETSLITPEFEELFDTTTDIDNSVVIIHHNGTETIVGITDVPYTEEMINSSTETTTSTEVEIFNPSDLISDTKQSRIEISIVTSELDETTELDYEDLREATTPRALDKPTIAIPHKLVINSLPITIEDEINTEIKFTDLEDTTDMFGPNFGHQSYETQTHRISIKSDTPDSRLKEVNYATTFLPIISTSSENKRKMTTESSQNVLFDQSLTNSNIKSIKNNTSLNIEYNSENISVETTEMYNDTNFLEIEIKNITTCINNSCFDNSKLNDELLDSQIETTSTTPFIIETKLLPNQAFSPFVNKKLLYPKEYPDEFDTIQNGPALTITKRTYTSIPDIVYTTTTMITLPTLDLIYKADKEIEKYLSEIQSTTIKPKNNNLSPLRNISSLNST